MICRNCGREMNNEATFCPYCGMDPSAPTWSEIARNPAPGSPDYSGPEAPVPGAGKKKGLFIGGAIGAVVLVIALAVVFASGLFANPKGQVEQAIAKSLAAYQAAEEALGMPDLRQWQRDRSISQGMRLELTGISSALIGYDLSALEGLGLEASSSYDGKSRRMFARLGVFWDEDDLFTAQIVGNDAELYVDIPHLTGEESYGVNTETIGADLAAMTGDDSMEGISFNLFDLVEKTLEQMDPEQLEESLQRANKALWDAAGVEKSGSASISVNGSETKVMVYQVVIPQDALVQYITVWEELLSTWDSFSLYEEILQATGLPQAEIDDLMDELDELDVYGQLADGLRDAVTRSGDLQLEVCVSGGYVSAVRWTGTIQRTYVEAQLYLGGGAEYVDDWSLEISSDGMELIELKSTGDHALSRGVYTDETTIRIREGSSTLVKISSQLSLNPKAQEDNFQWELSADSSGLTVFSLETQGDFSMDSRYIQLALGDVSMRVMGIEVCNLAFDYHVSNVPDQLSIHKPKLITQMTEDELMQMVQDTHDRLLQWSEAMELLFITRLPPELFGG